jgi:hypothetical protein
MLYEIPNPYMEVQEPTSKNKKEDNHEESLEK